MTALVILLSLPVAVACTIVLMVWQVPAKWITLLAAVLFILGLFILRGQVGPDVGANQGASTLTFGKTGGILCITMALMSVLTLVLGGLGSGLARASRLQRGKSRK